MLDNVTLASPNIPLNEQLVVLMRNEILDGLWTNRLDFPGEKELAQRFGVSVITSRKALDRLRDEGLIERGRGKRTRAIYEPQPKRAAAPHMFPIASRTFDYRVLSSEIAVGWSEACDTFGLPHGSELWQIKRLRMFEGRPHSVSYNAQLPEIGSKHALSHLKSRPMVDILMRTGAKPVRFIRRTGASLPPLDVAENLGISLQDPVLTLTFVVEEAHEKPLEWVRIYVHPDEPTPSEIIDIDGTKLLIQAP